MSHSCNSCRKSRRACDKRHPTCRTCQLRNVPCEYSRREHSVFVNFDAQNISRNKKKVLCGAIRELSDVERDQKANQIAKFDPANNQRTAAAQQTTSSGDQILGQLTLPGQQLDESTRLIAIDCLDLPEESFRQHLDCLWVLFQDGHSVTNTSWSLSYGSLIGNHLSLDLALFSLSLLRFAQSSGSAQLRVLSLTTYSQSLALFRELSNRRGAFEDPQLATTALVYALFEACLESPASLFQTGLLASNPHLKGAETIARHCSPVKFQKGHYHRAFEKMREMAVLSAFCSYEATFFAEACWMTTPWYFSVKSTRELLYDIAAEMTIPWDRASNESGKEHITSGDVVAAELRSIASRLSEWVAIQSATQVFYPPVDHLNESGPSLLQLDKTWMPSDMFLLVEYWALLLMLNLIQMKMFLIDSAWEAFGSRNACEHMAGTMCNSIRRALQLPIYGGGAEKKPGVVEGQCRSLLAACSVNEYDRVIRNF